MKIDRARRRIPIRTDDYSARLRLSLIDLESRSIRLTNFASSSQGDDLSTPPNSGGFGRIHHFRRDEGADWPMNPLPIDPACSALGRQNVDAIEAQVFQSAGCNWRCWYCYVPFEDLTGRRGGLVSVSEMVDAVQSEPRPVMVDLTGGQPDLTPEWPWWMLQALDAAGIDDVYVWSDDNLSTDYLWRYLDRRQIDYLGAHPRYGRACCLKGFDGTSFCFNTKASVAAYDFQFDVLKRLQQTTSIDYYLYVTFTTPTTQDLRISIRTFVDRLQGISEFLPLRTVPLRILEWGPVQQRMDAQRRRSLELQVDVVNAWQEELDRRFTGPAPPRITEVPR